jgi:predicted small lipoprotein YifL
VPSMTRAAALAVLISTGLALGGCGRKGDPDYPAGARVEKVERPDGTTKKALKKPSRPFVLDPLLN